MYSQQSDMGNKLCEPILRRIRLHAEEVNTVTCTTSGKKFPEILELIITRQKSRGIAVTRG